jgi:hypothetical protein
MLSKWVVWLLGLTIAAKVVEGCCIGLGYGRQSRSRTGDRGSLCRGLRLRRRERSTRSDWRVLRWLSASFCLFALFINVHGFITVQSHAAELDSSAIYSVIGRHNNGFLLFQNTALETSRASLRSSRLESRGCIARYRSTALGSNGW